MHIAILTWGISAERAVALRSSVNMHDWMQKVWHQSEVLDFPKDIDIFLENYKKYDLVIPVFHGIYGEDGQVTAFLETLGCKHAYSSFAVHSFCIDKYRTNLFVEKIWIKIPRSFYVARGHYIEKLELPIICYPVIVKPNRWGSSIDTTKIESGKDLVQVQRSIVDDDILIQECIEWREFTVWVYKDTSWYHALPIVEIRSKWDFFDYAEKYETDGSNEIFGDLPDTIRKPLEDMSTFIASAIGSRGVVRIDWRYDGKDFYFLEVNTIPGFTGESLVPKMWKKAGKDEGEFVEMLGV